MQNINKHDCEMFYRSIFEIVLLTYELYDCFILYPIDLPMQHIRIQVYSIKFIISRHIKQIQAVLIIVIAFHYKLR